MKTKFITILLLLPVLILSPVTGAPLTARSQTTKVKEERRTPARNSFAAQEYTKDPAIDETEEENKTIFSFEEETANETPAENNEEAEESKNNEKEAEEEMTIDMDEPEPVELDLIPEKMQPVAYVDIPKDIGGGILRLSDVSVILTNTGEAVHTVGQVSPQDYVTVQFTFNVPDTQNIQPGDFTVLSLPDEILLDMASNEYIVDIPLLNTDIVIATVTLQNGAQDLILTFTEEIAAYESITYAFFSLECQFNQAVLGDIPEKTIVFEYYSQSFPVSVRFYSPQLGIAKTLTSQGMDTETGAMTQQWLLTVNTEKAQLADIVIQDTVSTGLEIIGFCFEPDEKDHIPSGWTVATDVDSILFKHNGETAEEINITLYTQATDLRLLAIDPSQENSVICHNTLTVNAKNAASLERFEEVSVQVTASIYAGHIQKTGTFDGVNSQIIWEIQINENKDLLQSVKLYETIPDNLVLRTDKISITGSSDTYYAVGPQGSGNYDVSYTVHIMENAIQYIFSFHEDITDTITISLPTEIDSAELIETNATIEYYNEAYISWRENYSWVSSGSTGGNHNMFSKFSRGYDPDTRKISWGFSINQNQYTLDGDVTIVDRFMPAGYTDQLQGNPQISKIVAKDKSGNQTRLIENTHYKFTTYDSYFTLIFYDGVLNEKSAEITFTTEMLDMEAVAGNNNKHYYNSAIMTAGSRTYEKLAYANATPKILEKTGAYNYQDQTITWTITVNPHKVKGMGSIEITDNLPNGLILIAVYEGVLSDNTLLEEGAGYTYDSKTGKVTFSYPDGLDETTKILILLTKIDNTFFTKNQDNQEFKNQAAIAMSEIETTTTVTASVKLSNTAIGKTGSFSKETGVISWEVLINSNAVNWDLAEVVLTDPLPVDLQLDIDTVVLARYSLDEQGNESPRDEVLFDKNSCISYNLENNEFQFTFPENMNGQFAYRLFFDTDVLAAGTFNNTIYFTGYDISEENGNAVITVQDSGSLAGALANRKAKIQLLKLDASTKEPLNSAEYGLFSADGTLLETKTTDSNGMIFFETWLKIESGYYLIESQEPEGYIKSETPVAIYIARDEDGNILENTLNYITENVPEDDPVATNPEDDETPPDNTATNENGTPPDSNGPDQRDNPPENSAGSGKDTPADETTYTSPIDIEENFNSSKEIPGVPIPISPHQDFIQQQVSVEEKTPYPAAGNNSEQAYTFFDGGNKTNPKTGDYNNAAPPGLLKLVLAAAILCIIAWYFEYKKYNAR